MKSHLMNPAIRLISSQMLLLLLLFALVPVEMGLPAPQGIENGGAWNLEVSLDPAYPLRTALIGINTAIAILMAGLTWGVIRRRSTIGVEGMVLSISLTLLAMVKVGLWTPFWINGVPATYVMFPRPDMDPKALLPALWFPDFRVWQSIVFAIIFLLYMMIPTVAVVALRSLWQRHRWHWAVLSVLPVLMAIGLIWGTPGLGVWLGD